jgi:hypothetical protein
MPSRSVSGLAATTGHGSHGMSGGQSAPTRQELWSRAHVPPSQKFPAPHSAFVTQLPPSVSMQRPEVRKTVPWPSLPTSPPPSGSVPPSITVPIVRVVSVSRSKTRWD